jgi:hypothetical protein
MKFIPHIKGCTCNFCENGTTPSQYAIYHAGFFSEKESCLRAIDKTIRDCVEVDIDKGSPAGVINYMQCVREETEKFKDTDDVWKNNGCYKFNI